MREILPEAKIKKTVRKDCAHRTLGLCLNSTFEYRHKHGYICPWYGRNEEQHCWLDSDSNKGDRKK
jgi:hypothetical protein